MPISSSFSNTRRGASRRRISYFAASVVLGLALTGCSTSGTQATSGGGEITAGKVTIDTTKCPAGASESLSTGADIVIGTSLAQSGSGASSALSLGGINAYFDKINADGGVDGHKVTLNAKDDALDPARAVANVKALIEQDNVFATIFQLGTPQNLATRQMYETNCVPQLYASTGDHSFYDPANHPWSTSSFLPYDAWGEATAEFIDKKFPSGAKVAELVWNSDTGKALDEAFTRGIEGTSVEIVASQSHDSTAVSMSNQVTEMLAKSPDAIVAATSGAFCNQLVSAARRAGFGGPIVVPPSCRDTTQFFEPLGELADGLLTVRSSLDPADPTAATEPSMREYLEAMQKYQPSYDPRSTYVADGYRFAALLVEQLQRAASAEGGLNRINLINAVWSTDTVLPLNFPDSRTVINGDVPFPVGDGSMLAYDASTKSWEPTGVDVTASAP